MFGVYFFYQSTNMLKFPHISRTNVSKWQYSLEAIGRLCINFFVVC